MGKGFNIDSPPCEYCLDDCEKKSCNCRKCKLFDDCNKKLRPTIRITLKCTQSCSHCCFECGPDLDKHMTVETAKKVAKFIESNNIFSINLMGGEIFCNPDYKEIIEIFSKTGRWIRIVSNSDWVETDPSFAEFVSKFEKLHVCLSKDQWHTNKNIKEAEKLLNKYDVTNKTSDLNEKEFGLVPVGRAVDTFGLYSTMGTRCNNPDDHYSFLIDEDGKIYKCGFGVWDYAKIDNYIEGGFGERFKEFNNVFYKTFISSCKSCVRGYYNSQGKVTFF